MASLEGCSPAWIQGRLKVAAARGEEPIAALRAALLMRPAEVPPRLELARRLTRRRPD